ncbi:MAG: hypothetical protein P8K77_01405 [Polaribacter sp.]|nr:hypothetical protein [Polaribacter sp.]
MTYFGGKIINPKTNFILLYNQDKVIDSLLLDDDNKFIGEYERFKEGLYYFKHGPEYQYVYIEPKDSLLIRLNTWDFDESLVFSGKGADKNNILIDCFIESEEDIKNYKLYSFYNLKPTAFKTKLDSVLALKQEKINDFKAKKPALTDNYLLLLDIAVKYPIYNRFERYPEVHRRKTQETTYPKIDSTFYTYRTLIDTNIDSLMIFGAYSRYIVERLYSDVHSKGITPNAKEFIVTLLHSVDKNISNEKSKNAFLKNMLINDFYKKSSCAIDKKAFYTYFKLSSSIDDKKQVQRILNDAVNTYKGTKISNFKVTDYNGTEHSIKKLIKGKNTVLYFLPSKYIPNSNIASRINYLSKKFPKTTFLGIKFATTNFKPIQGIDIKSQFYIDQSSAANLFLTSKLPRTLLVAKNGKIHNGYTSVNSRLINAQIEKLQKN